MKVLLIAFLLLIFNSPLSCSSIKKPEIRTDVVQEADGTVTRFFFVVYKMLDQEFSLAVSVNMPKDLKVPISYILSEIAKKNGEPAILQFIEEIDRAAYDGFNDYQKLIRKMDSQRS